MIMIDIGFALDGVICLGLVGIRPGLGAILGLCIMIVHSSWLPCDIDLNERCLVQRSGMINATIS